MFLFSGASMECSHVALENYFESKLCGILC